VIPARCQLTIISFHLVPFPPVPFPQGKALPDPLPPDPLPDPVIHLPRYHVGVEVPHEKNVQADQAEQGPLLELVGSLHPSRQNVLPAHGSEHPLQIPVPDVPQDRRRARDDPGRRPLFRQLRDDSPRQRRETGSAVAGDGPRPKAGDVGRPASLRARSALPPLA